jgi:hypothetical protein
MTKFFRYTADGAESWEYINRDPSISYVYNAVLNEAVEETEDGQVFAINWDLECRSNDGSCVDRPLHTVNWRIDQSRGVFLAGLVPEGGAPLDYSPDVQLTLQNMDPGDSVATTTGGFTFESTFVGFVDCPVRWNGTEDWGDDCVQIDLTDGDADPSTNRGLVGSYYAIVGFDLIAWQGEEDGDIWELSDYVCEGEC